MINSLGLLVTILLGVAFITLLERKLLRYAQSRKGPNLVGPLGTLQPFRDGLKRLTKEEPLWGGRFFIAIPPLIFWIRALIFWFCLRPGGVRINLSLFWILVIRSLGGMVTFLTGWNGGRVYSVMGGIRASAQIISYEVVLSFLFLTFLFLGGSFRRLDLLRSAPLITPIWGFFLVVPLWGISLLAETNRAPFDLTEGERELVRGFNTEYSSLSFTLLFLGEYGIIIAFSMISSLLLMASWNYGILFAVFIMWIRSCFPRKRYDHLINLIWLTFFPSAITLLCLGVLQVLI